MPLRAPATALAVVVALAAACSHDAKPAVAPDEPPPLPPASGTPIGYLVDASELQLTGDQLTRLEAIDDELAARLAVLDGDLRAPRPAASGQPGRRRGGGMRGGGMRGGGMRGGAGQGGGPGGAGGGAGGPRGPGGGGPGGGAGSAAGPRPGNADAVNRVTEQRADAVRTAIAQSLGLLDPVQKIVARRVLTEHGVDVDAGRPVPATAGERDGDGDTEPEPDEPGSGSDR
jgi:hypothetical protein